MARVVLVVLFLFAQNAMSQTTFHGNNARTGVSDSAGPKVLGGVQWRFKTGASLVSSPAVGTSDTQRFLALDAETGRLLFVFDAHALVFNWNTQLYPASFAAYYVLADLLFQDRNLTEVLRQAERSRNLEPPLELRMNVTGDNLTGYWAGPFGRNGKLSGKK